MSANVFAWASGRLSMTDSVLAGGDETKYVLLAGFDTDRDLSGGSNGRGSAFSFTAPLEVAACAAVGILTTGSASGRLHGGVEDSGQGQRGSGEVQ